MKLLQLFKTINRKNISALISNIPIYIDYGAIPIGISALLSVLFQPQGELDKLLASILYYTAGFLGYLYLCYALYLYTFRRIKFDWKLTYGHLHRKVICVVLLMPFSLAISIAPFVQNPQDLLQNESPQTQNADSIPPIPQEQNLFWITYFHFVDAGNQHMATTPASRGMVGIIAILGIFLLNGLLVSSIIGFIDRKKEERDKGEIRYNARHFKKNAYAVVIGANEIIVSVIKNLLSSSSKANKINFKCEGKNEYIILQTNQEVESIRNKLASHLSPEELSRIIIYRALRNSKAELKNLNLSYATEIYVLGESTNSNNEESYHDVMNMQCVNLIAEILKEHLHAVASKREKLQAKKEVLRAKINALKGIASPNGQYKKIKKLELDIEKIRLRSPKRKICKVMLESQTSYSIFQFSDIPATINETLVFIPFNRYEEWARKVMIEGEAKIDCTNKKTIQYTPLDGTGLSPDSQKHVHFIIIGLSKMGFAMGLQALQQAHYLNYTSQHTRLTWIDIKADQEMDILKGRYSHLFQLTRNRYIDAEKCNPQELNTTFGWIDPFMTKECAWKHLTDKEKTFIDIDIEFIKGSIESGNVREYLRQISTDKNSKLTIAICLNQTNQAIAASLYMPIEIYDKAQQIWVYQQESAHMLLNLCETQQKDKRYKKLRPFGMQYGEYMTTRASFLKALLVNNAYKNGNQDSQEIYDMTNHESYRELCNSWKNLSIDKKFSNRYFVDSIYTKLRGIIPDDKKTKGIDVLCIKGIKQLIVIYTQAELEKSLNTSLREHQDILAECEHNRWNMQQLLFDYTPCNAKQDDEFKQLNQILRKWKQEHHWDTLKEDAKKKLQQTEDYQNFHQIEITFKEKKESYKNSEYRIHPNLCGNSHLDEIDYRAKDYDTSINNEIARILILVDLKAIENN